MSSHAQDQTTQKAASAAALAAQQQQTANAATAQTAAQQEEKSLYGSYNPSTGTYSGGSESAFLDPSQLNQKNLNGTFLNAYNNENNQLTSDTNNGVKSTMQSMANRGLGSSPAGFEANEALTANNQAATTRGNLYSSNMGAQNDQAENNYWNATSGLNSLASQNQAAATGNLSGAAGTAQNLYSTASTQVANPWATAAGSLASLGTAGAGYMPKSPGCWIAAEVFGGWDDPRTHEVRAFMFSPKRGTFVRKVAALYLEYGERLAAAIRGSSAVRAFFTPLVYLALRCARRA